MQRTEAIEPDATGIAPPLGEGTRRDAAVSRPAIGTVTVIVPAYNEKGIAGQVLDDLVRIMDGSGYNYEIIFVDDGSEDETWREAQQRGVKLIRHRDARPGPDRPVRLRRAERRDSRSLFTDLPIVFHRVIRPARPAGLADKTLGVAE